MDVISTLQTGGAEGADTEFARVALEHGHRAHVMTFRGHHGKEAQPQGVVRKEQSRADLDNVVKNQYERARKLLWRAPPKSAYVRDLLARNYFAVKHAETVYAITDFEDASPADPAPRCNVNISGGTAYACQMFASVFPDDDVVSELIPLYVFAQTNSRWYQCRVITSTTAAPLFGWEPMSQPPPPPTGTYAGIGARSLKPSGRQAIRSLYQRPASPKIEPQDEKISPLPSVDSELCSQTQ